MEAFQYFQKCPKPMVTAAGKLPPAQVLVIGAGVAGLSAIGYCKSLGCVVKAMDTRSAAKSDAESMGAKFVQVEMKEEGSTAAGYAKEMSADYQKAQYELTKNTAKIVDIIITTALIPGRKAPILLSEEIVQGMQAGSVIVDMAAEMGGNCALTKPGEVYTTNNGVIIIGFIDLVSRMAPQSSELYANNLYHLLDNLGGASKFVINLEDEIISSMCVVNNGQVTWSPSKPLPPVSAKPKSDDKPDTEKGSSKKNGDCEWDLWLKSEFLVISLLLIALFIGISYATTNDFMSLMMTFVLAVFIGYMVIWNVSPALHTPLMSVTNAIAGIIVIGAMMCLEPESGDIDIGSVLGMLSVLFASINIWGGFIVTYRMLQMFKTQNNETAAKHK
jgi:NAD(P) transhydrogenase subunit alpha